MDEQRVSKWIVCRICLKTPENEMTSIFDTASNLAEQIADYGSIEVCIIDSTLEIYITIFLSNADQ